MAKKQSNYNTTTTNPKYYFLKMSTSIRLIAKLIQKVWMSIYLDLDIFEKKYFAVLFYD